ncbi:uncharacterized protein CLUP02_16316 [Colletotrichum lupini]|uniref:Uncharacterized protein n=1 Tax=Colletotrichum lupini TaxID=145971 RepID=A0A9Q8WPJ4_9PEZI|nr:uncharacterized protein CLUP02_16316 [Colletotrichum lupini]UQC90786.1 hypothetical protein CLUP02_16316 [Colletotrichum lupini]
MKIYSHKGELLVKENTQLSKELQGAKGEERTLGMEGVERWYSDIRHEYEMKLRYLDRESTGSRRFLQSSGPIYNCAVAASAVHEMTSPHILAQFNDNWIESIVNLLESYC